ncbi:MAG: 3-dehydroquinate synthase [Chloroflexi bacterium]|nr:3-dehydroquinate synthase [Chloroflexota bacterium]
MVQQLTINGGQGPYPVIVGPGAFMAHIPQIAGDYGRIVIVTNETIAPLFGEDLRDALPNSNLIVLPDGEAYKTLDTVRAIYDGMLATGANRGTLVLGLGGGVIGDMAGFAAATFMRGVDYLQAPTTLLAMVDASIGGKVGVNLPQGKNLVGAFKDPVAVVADTDTLETLMRLKPLEYTYGMAEVIKAGLLRDPWLLDYPRSGSQEEMVARAIRVKAHFVEKDRLEQGVRAYLNLGHTFAHAIEKVSKHEAAHGLAVGIGLAAAARLSWRLGLADWDLVQQVVNRLEGWNLMHMNYWDPDAIWEAMRHDKKWRDGVSRFVLLRGIGDPVLVEDVAREDVIAVLDDMMPPME